MKTSFLIDKKQFPRLDLICDKNSARFALEHVQIDHEFVVATNSHVMAWAKTQDVFGQEARELIKPGESWLVKSDHWAKIARAKAGFFLPGKGIEVDGVTYPFDAEDYKYPNYKAVIPEFVYQESENKPDLIGLNAELLVKLTKAMRCELVALIPQTDKAMLALPIKHGRYDKASLCCGLIMPIYLKDAEAEIKSNYVKP